MCNFVSFSFFIFYLFNLLRGTHKCQNRPNIQAKDPCQIQLISHLFETSKRDLIQRPTIFGIQCQKRPSMQATETQNPSKRALFQRYTIIGKTLSLNPKPYMPTPKP